MIGIDIGATKTAAARVDVMTGTMSTSCVWPTRPERGGATVLADCVRAVHEFAGTVLTSVGIGICETVDPAGCLQSADTLDWHGIDLDRAFEPHRVRLESDVRAAARAEATFGAGRGADELLYISVGSGISYCLVAQGKPRLGAHGLAIILGAPPIEQVAGGLALAAAAGVASAEEVFDAPEHRGLISRAATELGRAIAGLINALDPDLVVIGGGLGLADSYRQEFLAIARQHLWAPAELQPEFVRAELGTSAGVIGAALAATASDPFVSSHGY